MVTILGLMNTRKHGVNMNKYIQQGADSLSPCPCCGHIPQFVDYEYMGLDGGYAYKCQACGFMAEAGYTFAEARYQWNFQAQPKECQIEGRVINYATGTNYPCK